MDARRQSRILLIAGFVALFATGCGGAGAQVGSIASPAQTATASPPPKTASPTSTSTTATVDCASSSSFEPGSGTVLSLPLPPHTTSHMLGAAAGAGFYLECTPNATQSALVSSLNAAYQQAGWTRWNPASDNAGGCGTQPNAYWQWANGQEAVGWDFRDVSLPEWHLSVCALAYATPTS